MRAMIPVSLPARFSSFLMAARRAPNALCGLSLSSFGPPGGSGRWQVRQSLSFLARRGPKCSASAFLYAGLAHAGPASTAQAHASTEMRTREVAARFNMAGTLRGFDASRKPGPAGDIDAHRMEVRDSVSHADPSRNSAFLIDIFQTA